MAMPFKHDWILMNGLFSLCWMHDDSVNCFENIYISWLMKYTWKTPTPTCFWPKYILTPLPFTPYYFPLYLIFLRTSFSQVKKKRTSHFQCLCHWYCLVRVFLCVDMDHGKYPSQLLTVKNTLLSSIFSISERKKSVIIFYSYQSPTKLYTTSSTTIKLNPSVFDSECKL